MVKFYVNATVAVRAPGAKSDKDYMRIPEAEYDEETHGKILNVDADFGFNDVPVQGGAETMSAAALAEHRQTIAERKAEAGRKKRGRGRAAAAADADEAEE